MYNDWDSIQSLFKLRQRLEQNCKEIGSWKFKGYKIGSNLQKSQRNGPNIVLVSLRWVRFFLELALYYAK